MCLNPLTNSCQLRGAGDLDYFHCSCTGTGYCIKSGNCVSFSSSEIGTDSNRLCILSSVVGITAFVGGIFGVINITIFEIKFV